MIPIQLIFNIVKLIPKKGGGERPITLMPLLRRLFFNMQGQVMGEWCDKKARWWDAAVKGSSALRAALMSLLGDEISANI